MECFTPHNVSELLTGCGLTTTSISDALDEFRASIDSGLERIEAYAADSAGHVRAALRAIASESAESPRLFSLRLKEPTRLGRMAFWQHELILTLWCEHPGSEHPCKEGDYRLHASKDWFADVAPYLRLVLRTLTILAPVATWASAEFLSKDAGTSMKDRIKLMEALIAQLPEGSRDTLADLGAITAAEGASLRQVQSMLIKIDPDKRWGDLRRKLTVSGDYVWVCPEHYQVYDPGLPTLPS